MLEQRFGVAREPEEVVLLGRPLHLVAFLVDAILHLVLGDERLLVLAIPAGMLAEVDVVGCTLLYTPDQLEDTAPMAALGGSDELVIVDVDLLPEAAVRLRDPSGQFARLVTSLL